MVLKHPEKWIFFNVTANHFSASPSLSHLQFLIFFCPSSNTPQQIYNC
uniref:Uncharacterized protein n=1 Tax=Anguilla anguilla TaxID=7936 RepID=A0A0E9V0H5_ANGAN